MLLNDFTVRAPQDLLAGLRGQSPTAAPGGAMPMPSATGPSMAGKAMGGMKADLADVQYDALLTNRRTLDDPDVVRVQPRQTIRVRLIAASSATNFWIDTDTLTAQAIAVDGEEIVPWQSQRFALAIAQRLDLRLTIPAGEGAYPILAQGEGADLQTGLVLATPHATMPVLTPKAERVAGALTNAQELQLRAARPMPAKPVDRTLQVALNGDLAKYVWAING